MAVIISNSFKLKQRGKIAVAIIAFLVNFFGVVTERFFGMILFISKKNGDSIINNTITIGILLPKRSRLCFSRITPFAEKITTGKIESMISSAQY